MRKIQNTKSIRTRITNKTNNSIVVKNKTKKETKAEVSNIDNFLGLNSQGEEQLEAISKSKEFKRLLKPPKEKKPRGADATPDELSKIREKYPNLRMLNDVDPEERAAICRKGALAAHAKRRENLKMKDCIQAILSCDATLDEKQKKIATQYGILSKNGKKLNNNMLLLLTLFKKALDGNIMAIEKIQDLVGENPWLEKAGDMSANSGVTINFVGEENIK